ncbi:tRNA-splicing endonuclease (tRNA-intron endonuclease) [Durusdinium trenchii]|uniref:tRNA-intron lyase n=1 Tax=Durusdinium trenchii TaxID=1381693 RepID=A0ABP0JET9_9DINO
MAQEEEEAKPPAVPRGIWAGAGATNVLICAQQDIETVRTSHARQLTSHGLLQAQCWKVEAALHAQEAAQVQGFGRQQLTRGTLEGTDEVAEDEGGRGRKDASGSEGKADATRTLLEQVTLVEAYYMLERGQLRVCAIKQDGPEEELSAAEAWRVFGASQAYSSPRRFAVMYNAYKSLREQGWIVKMGQTYGAHFAVYQGDPDFFHSQFCILVADEDKDEPCKLLVDPLKALHC